MTKKLESEIYAFLRERNWHEPHPADVSKSICIEAAELLEVFQWGTVSAAQIKKDKKMFSVVKGELADVFIYALVMAVSLGLKTNVIIREKLQHVKKKYPPKLMRLARPANNAAYHSIKQRYRKAAHV